MSLPLDRGPDINAVGGRPGTALVIAAFWGEGDIISLLLDRGADIKAVGAEYGIALASAAYAGNGDSFITAGSRSMYKRSGRQVCVCLCCSRISDDLVLRLFHGVPTRALYLQGACTPRADINVVRGYYGAALTAAAYQGEKDIASLLLARKTDVHMLAGTCETSLATAASPWRGDVASLLLTTGADLHVVSGVSGATLAIAAVLGSRAIADDTSSTGDHDARGSQLLSQLEMPGRAGGAVGEKHGSALGLATDFGDTETV